MTFDISVQIQGTEGIARICSILKENIMQCEFVSVIIASHIPDPGVDTFQVC